MRTVTAVLAAAAIALTLAGMLDPTAPGLSRVHAQQAQTPSADDIAKALSTRKTRGVGQAAAPANAKEIQELIKIRKTRGWNQHDRVRLAKATEELAQIDLVIYFAFDSADVQKESEPVLDRLGEALKRDEYKGRVFVVAGHTDAKGTAGYNQSLSERRAESVKRYVVGKYKLSAEDILTVGHGFEQLKDKQDPLSGTNRRVQIVNLTQ
jgi:outer membrane protein OmpA-like peptidoglycan-associated protein